MTAQVATDWAVEIPPPASTEDEGDAGLYPTNDAERAKRFGDYVSGTLRFVHGDTWHVWDGTRWIRDEGADLVAAKADEFLKLLRREAAEIDDHETGKKAFSAATTAGNRPKRDAMIAMAKHHPDIATRRNVFDRDPMLLGVRNGVVDLRTGTFRQATREDYITKQAGTAYDPDARCPEWEKFLHAAMVGDGEMIEFIQRAIGYGLTGKVSEQCLFFFYGSGSNGKSTFSEAMIELFGHYSQKAPAALFTADRNGKDPEKEIARLNGMRFVVGAELDEGCRLAESRVKDLTGQDTLVGRHLYQSAFEFAPSHKLYIYGNHKPEVKGADLGIWRRIRLIPFLAQIADKDKDRRLPEKLAAELPGILNWAIAGCLKWQAGGLPIPKKVGEATAEYRVEEDGLGDFIEEKCNLYGEISRAMLYQSYRQWAETNGIMFKMTSKTLARQLRARPGIEEGTKSSGERRWRGLSLRGGQCDIRSSDRGVVLDFGRAHQGTN